MAYLVTSKIIRNFVTRNKMRGHIEAFFALSFSRKSPIFKTTKEEAVIKTLMLVAYPLPDKGYRYPIRRGSGLFICSLAFGDASLKINKKSFHALFISP